MSRYCAASRRRDKRASRIVMAAYGGTVKKHEEECMLILMTVSRCEKGVLCRQSTKASSEVLVISSYSSRRPHLQGRLLWHRNSETTPLPRPWAGWHASWKLRLRCVASAAPVGAGGPLRSRQPEPWSAMPCWQLALPLWPLRSRQPQPWRVRPCRQLAVPSWPLRSRQP